MRLRPSSPRRASTPTPSKPFWLARIAEVRRLAVLALSGSGSAIGDDERLGHIRKALSDTSFMVRLEAVRAWTRRGVKEHGCQPLLDALNDPSLHVVLGAIDALGDVCRDDAAITTRMASEARTPRPNGRWQREMHAFVALAKRDRERAAISMLAFAMHQTWQVRMYTARAAAVVDDVAVLTRLASDSEDNVAEAALSPLRRLDRRRERSVVRRRPQSQNANRSAKRRAPVRGHPHRRAGARWCDVDAGAGDCARRRARTHQRRAVRDVARYAARAHHPSRPARLGGSGEHPDASPQRPRPQSWRRRRGCSRAVDGQGCRDRHAAPEVDQHTDRRASSPIASEFPSRWTAGAGSISSWMLWTRR